MIPVSERVDGSIHTLNVAVSCGTKKVGAFGGDTVPSPFEHLYNDGFGRAGVASLECAIIAGNSDASRETADGGQDEGTSQLEHAEHCRRLCRGYRPSEVCTCTEEANKTRKVLV